MKYLENFSYNEYNVLIQHEIEMKKIGEISRQLSVSRTRVDYYYRHALVKKTKAYISHLASQGIATLKDLEDLVWNKRLLYQHPKYVVAFLESEYSRMLSEYRNGEPGSPIPIEKFSEVPVVPPIHQIPAGIDYDKSWEIEYRYITLPESIYVGNLVSIRIELTPFEKSLVYMRKEEALTYALISDNLRITPEKAQHMFKIARTILYRACIADYAFQHDIPIKDLKEYIFESDEILKKTVDNISSGSFVYALC